MISVLTLAAIATVILLIWVMKLIDHTQENKLMRVFYFVISIIASVLFFGFAIFVSMIVLFFSGIAIGDNPPSANYHVLNAAIKNTCFLDPQKNHCPKTAQDIINIEPERFTKLTKDAHLTYEYYPQTNEYTLIVKNNNLQKNDYRVVIFDPRLAKAKNYGRGFDFVDAEVIWCNGKYVLKDPPPFSGPWDKIN